MDVTVLGTGSPLAPNRCATGLLVTADGCEPLLIDTCGGFELPRQLARIGQPIGGLRNVIVTHRHLDHAGGMPSLFLANIPLTIHAQTDTHAGIAALMDACFPEWAIHPAVERMTIEAGDRREIGGFTVEFFGAEHRVPTVAVRVTQGGRVLAFSADGVPNAGMVECARDADLFLCDALCAEADGAEWAARARQLMHPIAREAAEMAVAANARALVLVHLARYAHPENVLAEACAVYDGPVSVPDDCARFTV